MEDLYKIAKLKLNSLYGTTATWRDKMRSLNREGKSGYEVAFMLRYLSTTYYRWELVRYPLDVHNNEPTETILFLEGRFKWEDAIDAAEKYLKDHPDDGFSDL